MTLTLDPQPRSGIANETCRKQRPPEQSLWDLTSGPKPSLLLDHTVTFKGDTTRAAVLRETEDRDPQPQISRPGTPNPRFKNRDLRYLEPRVQTPQRQPAPRTLPLREPAPKVQIPRGNQDSAPWTSLLPPGTPEHARSRSWSVGRGLTSAYAELSTGQQSRSARPGAIRAAPIATA